MRNWLSIYLRAFINSSIPSSSSRFISFTSLNQWQVYENERYYAPNEDIRRVWHGLTYDARRAARRYREARNDAFRRKYPIAYMKREVNDYELLPFRCDFLIIGGGLTGSSTAYWLKQAFRDENLTVSVIESTENFSKSRSMLGCGAISQQFSIPEFVDLALYSAEYLRHSGEHLKILDNEPPDINLLPVCFMHLAKTEEESGKFNEAWKMQLQRGVHVSFLKRVELQQKFPFMNFDDIVSGTLGTENEGIIDTWQLLSALREKNITLGVRYIKAEVEGFMMGDQPDIYYPARHGAMPTAEANLAEIKSKRIDGVYIRPQMTGASARPIRTFQIINAAGPWSGEIARLAGIGEGADIFSVPVPIVCTRRTHFLIHAPEVPAMQMPAIVDPNGIFCFPDDVGRNYICGRLPTKVDAVKMKIDPESKDVPIDYNEFFEFIWPNLTKRVPAFQNSKVINAWHSFEDTNTFDGVPVLGEHYHYSNLYQMCGLGGYGPQMSLAMGRLYMERAYDEAYTTVNVRKFDMRRIMVGKRFEELYRSV